MKVKSLAVSIITLSIASCQSNEIELSAQEKEAVSRLNWVENLELKEVFMAAKAAGDFRLYKKSSRGGGLIGVPQELQSKAIQLCGSKTIQGLSDVRYGEVHKQLAKKANRFAEDYNKLMLSVCLETKS
ncbi:MAG: hypothetical protein OQK51_01575 [Kangiellaceae bacterium]|nr:hypothetical protein [Kangiellaceae bacterium]